MPKDVIIALDFPNKSKTLDFLSQFQEEKPYVKIGMELFYAEGPSIVREIKERGHKIFLDLKLHDIPNTVYSAMRVLSSLGVDMVNVHAAGTKRMMQAAKQGLVDGKGNTLLIAVTQLTSTDQETMNKELLIPGNLADVVSSYAKNAFEAGCDGVVCSPLEVEKVHCDIHPSFLTVTPGIRFADNTADDQKRVTTPAKARELGSDYIVVGRAITKASDPIAAYRRCLKDFLGE